MLKKPASNGFMKFFLTERGRKVTLTVASWTTIGLFIGNFAPHTFGLKYYQRFVQSYQDGCERPLKDKWKERLRKAMDILELRDFERTMIKPFTVVGFDIFQAGSTNYRFGCILGIPVNYGFSSIDEIPRQDIKFRNQSIKWDSEAGKLLENAIVLDEEEQIFSFCKSILLLQSQRVLLNSTFPCISFLSMYVVGSYLNRRLNLYASPFPVRFIMYTILGLFGIGTWSFMKDFTQVSYDAEIDKKLALFGPEFVEAGVRYYDKLLKKNMALRELIGDDTYTARGNENNLIRNKSLPLTIRKSFFESKLEELKAKTGITAPIKEEKQ